MHTSTEGIELRHLKLVSAIAEEGTITAASVRLNLTQSALSHQLSQVEEMLGLKLFLRLPRKMAITPAGETLLASARAILTELDRACTRLCSAADSHQGTLRIATECYTCYHWLPAHLKAFENRYPGVDVRIVVEATHRPIEALNAGKLDIAIVCCDVDRRDLSVTPLFEDELVVLMNPAHPLAVKPWIAAQDFEGEHLIGYSVSLKSMRLYIELLEPAGIQLRRFSRVELTEAILEMVKAGLGIAVLARWAVEPYLNPATLVSRPLTRHGFLRKWVGVTRRRKKQTPWIADFLNLLAVKTGSHPPTDHKSQALAHR
ncbi:MAG: LysR family transcriptional regulator [Acidobacteriota bacterium]|nr:LysR family transcriptional regulator [Acidobacteriota bacterium]